MSDIAIILQQKLQLYPIDNLSNNYYHSKWIRGRDTSLIYRMHI